MYIPRYKLVIQTTIGQMKDQGIRVASRCLWDLSTDNYSAVNYTNVSEFWIILTCFRESSCYNSYNLMLRNRYFATLLYSLFILIKDFDEFFGKKNNKSCDAIIFVSIFVWFTDALIGTCYITKQLFSHPIIIIKY